MHEVSLVHLFTLQLTFLDIVKLNVSINITVTRLFYHIYRFGFWFFGGEVYLFIRKEVTCSEKFRGTHAVITITMFT